MLTYVQKNTGGFSLPPVKTLLPFVFLKPDNLIHYQAKEHIVLLQQQ